MTLQTTQLPYEFLARWGADGKLQGCHVQWRYIVSDGATTLAESLSEAQAVTSATTYPLADLLDQVQAAAVAAAGDAQAALAAAQAQLQAEAARADGLAEQLTQAQERLAVLELGAP
ncbi:hypothetical protein [Azospirillum sp. B4]|uniref:hypothetical protein n=1 Tax=Azospirillum sp. B4 TaxID=95605 RepID=UPI0003451DE5|nr:hypothetical protein [Azospirillum sp. B4]